MKIIFLSIPLICLALFAAPAAPEPAKTPLTLQDYLKQVRERNEGVQASIETAEAAKERIDEGSLLLSPNLFANITLSDDKKPTPNPGFQGDQTIYESYQLGVSKVTSFGLGAKLHYTFAHIDIRNASPLAIPQPNVWEARPTLELSQSLWRNGFGSETSAGVEAARALAASTSLAETFKLKMLLTQAEMAYWRVVVARELIGVQELILESSKRIREWNSRRTKMALADRADLLQSEAGFQARSLELQGARDEGVSAEHAFNSLRSSTEPLVSEKLETLDPNALTKMVAPEKKGHREDVLAAEEGRKAAEAAVQMSLEKNRPNLDVFGSVSLNARETGLGSSMGNSLKTDRPTISGGVKFSTPLDLGQLANDRSAYHREKKAAELNYRRKLFEEEHDWKELVRKLEDAKRRLTSVLEFQTLQKQKLDHERDRLKRGRSITYQVLLFEQDYANAEALRLKTELEILSVLSQLRTYTVATATEEKK